MCSAITWFGLADDGVMVMIDFDIGCGPLPSPRYRCSRGAGLGDGGVPARRGQPGDRHPAWVPAPRCGLTDIDIFGVQRYLTADDPVGSALLASAVKSLAPVILSAGIATEAELALDTLQERLAHDLQANGAVGLIPAVVGAWGRKRPG